MRNVLGIAEMNRRTRAVQHKAPPMCANRKALIVDDNPDVAKMLTSFFRQRGYSVTHASHLDAARSLADREQADVILVDNILGQASGIGLVRDLRSRGCPAAIILMSGYFEPAEINQGLEAGANLVITKPIRDLVRLADFIDCCLRRVANQFQNQMLCISNRVPGRCEDSLEATLGGASDILASCCARKLQFPMGRCDDAGRDPASENGASI